jgi:type IV secretion system protein VirD4
MPADPAATAPLAQSWFIQQGLIALGQATAFVRRQSAKLLFLVALWTLFIGWTGWQIISLGCALLFEPSYPFQISMIPGLFAFNLWSFAAGIVFALIIINPFGWLNGKRLIFGSMALAMMLGRLISGGLVGLLLFYVSINWIIVFVLSPFALLASGVSAILATALTATIIFTFLVGVPVVLFNQIFAFEKGLNIYRYQARGLTSYIVRAAYWLRNERLPKVPPDDSKGARFATPAEVVRLHQPDAMEAMAFGHMGNPLLLKTDKHVLIMASTRSGKGVTLIIPHLLRYPGSAFVLDPKGENARATGRQRAKLNDKVHYLDPFGISGKPQSRFNPLARFTPSNMEAESKALASALFVLSERERDHWSAAGQQLLAAIILYVYVSPDIPPSHKDLPNVRRILLGGLRPALNAMTEIDDADGLLRDLAVSFLTTPEREFGSVVSTTQRQTEILDNPFMIACLSAAGPGQEVDFKLWHTGTMTVYLCLSAPKFPVFNRWLRLVLTSALDEMTDTLNPPKVPVCFMLDELATLGHLAAVENAVGLAAGYGIQLVTVFQDTAQMRDLYKGRWASFIGNAGVRALFNLDDFDTAEYWSKFIGGHLVETVSSRRDLYGYTQDNNVGEAMRPLLPSDKLMMDFASGKMLVLAQGAHPIITKRVPYWLDKGLDGLWDDPRRPLALRQPPRQPGPSSAPSSSPSPPPPRSAPTAATPAPKPTHAPPAADATATTLGMPPGVSYTLQSDWKQK